jgi:hypothetical protein
VAVGEWAGTGRVRLLDVLRHTSFASFEAQLSSRAGVPAWLGAFDMPLGLPRPFVESLALGATMDEVIAAVHARCPTRMAFRALIDAWTSDRPKGQKLIHRRTDVIDHGPSSTSPLQTRYVPVAWMYYEGVQRLVRHDVSVPGMRRGRSDAVALEGYPARLAFNIVGRRSYKNTDDDARRQTRREIVAALQTGRHAAGVAVDFSPTCEALAVDDSSGDTLDAILCLAQAAWASSQVGHGLPPDVDPIEGWIVAS